MRIGVVCYASVGGSGVVATELAHALALRGHEVHLVSSELPFRWRSHVPGLSFERVLIPAYPLFREPQYVLALGTVSLYLTGDVSDPRIPAWMRVRSLSELKTLLWEAILLVLVMAALTSIMANTEHLGWDLLILPAAVLILSAGLFLKVRTGE